MLFLSKNSYLRIIVNPGPGYRHFDSVDTELITLRIAGYGRQTCLTVEQIGLYSGQICLFIV